MSELLSFKQKSNLKKIILSVAFIPFILSFIGGFNNTFFQGESTLLDSIKYSSYAQIIAFVLMFVFLKYLADRFANDIKRKTIRNVIYVYGAIGLIGLTFLLIIISSCDVEWAMEGTLLLNVAIQTILNLLIALVLYTLKDYSIKELPFSKLFTLGSISIILKMIYGFIIITLDINPLETFLCAGGIIATIINLIGELIWYIFLYKLYKSVNRM